jgi:hypothetical protein
MLSAKFLFVNLDGALDGLQGLGMTLGFVIEDG